MRSIIILGASGNIGQQALQIIKENPLDFELKAIGIGKNIALGEEIIKNFTTIKIVNVQDEETKNILASKYPQLNITFGMEGYNNLFQQFPSAIVLNAISGFAGLYPTLQALKTKNRLLLLANKESLVVAGHLINEILIEYQSQLLPVDSEHCAILQSLNQNNSINEILLTASGGMFVNKTLEELKTVDDQTAFNHPNWKMGLNITIDSSTMVNKAFEIIEAYHLFKTKKITVLIHPQSIIHSAVQYDDYTIIAQLSQPSMLQVINYALYYPNHKFNNLLKPLDFNKMTTLTLQKADLKRWKALEIGYQCLTENNSIAVAFNAANEQLRAFFIAGKIRFYQIVEYLEYFVQKIPLQKLSNYEQIKELNDTIKREIIKYFD